MGFSLEAALSACRKYTACGKVASYIPELQKRFSVLLFSMSGGGEAQSGQGFLQSRPLIAAARMDIGFMTLYPVDISICHLHVSQSQAT